MRYPVVQDNDYGTWNAYANQYWPAEYLIDRSGHVRHAHFGEGEYDKTEELIRKLLGVDRRLDDGGRRPDADGLAHARVVPRLRARRPLRRATGAARPAGGRTTSRRLAAARPRVRRAVDACSRSAPSAGRGAELRVHFQASKVYLVLGGHGNVDVLVDGKKQTQVRVDGDRLYTLVRLAEAQRDALLELRFTPGHLGVRVHVRLTSSATSAK